MSDCIDFADIDLDTLELYRGDTPADIEHKCFRLCKDYLGGAWIYIPQHTIVFKRLAGGFTNQLYYCALPSDTQPIGDEPREVAIRIYGEKHFNEENERQSEAIIALLMSENNLGPKVYGVFCGGQIIEYIRHHQFGKKDQTNPLLVKELARLSAKTHALRVPMAKSNYIWNAIHSFYDEAYQTFPIDQWIEECNCETLKKYPLKKEIEWLKRVVAQSNSPITFSHNDFRGCNVLVREDLDPSDSKSPKMVICDFEYNSYSYRGIDFGTLFFEWGRSYNEYKDAHVFPDDWVLKQFVNYYIDECVKIFGSEYLADKNNSAPQLLKEIKVFTLFAYIFFTLLVMKMNEPIGGKTVDKKQQMPYIDISHKNYMNLKYKFIAEKAANY